MQLGNGLAHLQTQLGVQVGQGFVHQQHLRLNHQGARQSHALALPARQRCRQALRQPLQADLFQRRADLARDTGTVLLARTQTVSDVVKHALVRKERVVLKHHAHIAPVRRHLRHVLRAKKHAPRVDLNKARQTTQQSGLATTAGAQQGEKTALFNAE